MMQILPSKKFFQLTLSDTSIKQMEMSVVIRTSAMHACFLKVALVPKAEYGTAIKYSQLFADF